MPPSGYRRESDLLGEVRVPAEALYGAQTQRAVENFPLCGLKTLGDFPLLVRGLVWIKQAAAAVNGRIGRIDPAVAEAIVAAGHDVVEHFRPTDFPVHALHGGGGTSANMNVNEVLANLAEERRGGRRGEYRQVHPNDHVNAHQSTNDVYPTACHIAVIEQAPAATDALRSLAMSFERKGVQFAGQRRIARTCLQDAVATTFPDLFGGYVAFLHRATARIDGAVDALHAVSLGGTIVGRAEDVPGAYREAIVPALCEAAQDPRYRPADNLFDAAQHLDDLVQVSAQLDLAARGLIKICRDLRLLASGPEAGLGEIRLPPVQPGSSCMPGKINPVIPEYAIQLGFRIMGHHATCQAALDHGELDLNIWESAVVCSVIESLELMEGAARTLADRCVDGLEVDAVRNNRHADSLIPRLTELMKRYGYARVSAVCAAAPGDPERLRVLLAETFPDPGDEAQRD